MKVCSTLRFAHLICLELVGSGEKKEKKEKKAKQEKTSKKNKSEAAADDLNHTLNHECPPHGPSFISSTNIDANSQKVRNSITIIPSPPASLPTTVSFEPSASQMVGSTTVVFSPPPEEAGKVMEMSHTECATTPSVSPIMFVPPPVQHNNPRPSTPAPPPTPPQEPHKPAETVEQDQFVTAPSLDSVYNKKAHTEALNEPKLELPPTLPTNEDVDTQPSTAASTQEPAPADLPTQAQQEPAPTPVEPTPAPQPAPVKAKTTPVPPPKPQKEPEPKKEDVEDEAKKTINIGGDGGFKVVLRKTQANWMKNPHYSVNLSSHTNTSETDTTNKPEHNTPVVSLPFSS